MKIFDTLLKVCMGITLGTLLVVLPALLTMQTYFTPMNQAIEEKFPEVPVPEDFPLPKFLCKGPAFCAPIKFLSIWQTIEGLSDAETLAYGERYTDWLDSVVSVLNIFATCFTDTERLDNIGLVGFYTIVTCTSVLGDLRELCICALNTLLACLFWHLSKKEKPGRSKGSY